MAAKKKKYVKKQNTNVLGKMGAGSFGILSFILTMFSPQLYGGDGSDINPNQVPPFVAIIATVFAVAIIGFVIYVGALLLF